MSTPNPRIGVYVISVAAELTGLHPQTLRSYDRMGLVSPRRSGGGGRRYSLRDIDALRTVAELTAAGIGLEGVRQILALQDQVADLQSKNLQLKKQNLALQLALDTAGQALQARKPNLPAIRPRGTIIKF